MADCELLDLYYEFCRVHAELDRLLAGDDDPPEAKSMELHRRWRNTLSRTLKLPATTSSGHHAKATMFLAALGVVLGTDDSDVLPQELVAGEKR